MNGMRNSDTIRVLLVAGIIILLCATAGCTMFNAVKVGSFGSPDGGSGGGAPGRYTPAPVSPAGGQSSLDDDVIVSFAVECKENYEHSTNERSDTGSVSFKGEVKPLRISRHFIDENTIYSSEQTSQMHMSGVHEVSCVAPCESYKSIYDGPTWVNVYIRHDRDTPKKNLIAWVGSEMGNHLTNNHGDDELGGYVTIERTGTGDYSGVTPHNEAHMFAGIAAECFMTDMSIVGSWQKPIQFEDSAIIDYTNKDDHYWGDAQAVLHFGSGGGNPISYTKPDTLAPLVTTPKKP